MSDQTTRVSEARAVDRTERCSLRPTEPEAFQVSEPVDAHAGDDKVGEKHGRGLTKQTRIIGEKLCEDGQNPSSLSHDRLHQRGNLLKKFQGIIGSTSILQMSKGFDVYVGHGIV